MKKIASLILVPLFVFLPVLVVLTEPVYADTCGSSDAAKQVFQGISEATSSSSCDDSGVTKVVNVAINVLSLVVGIAAVIVIIVSGFKYITSGGDSGRVGNAKNTLIYAVIGLVLATLAQFLIHFVLFQTNSAATPKCSDNPTLKPPACQ